MHTTADIEPRSVATPSARASIVVAVVGLLWLALHVSGIVDSTGDYTSALFALLGVGATVVGLRRSRPRPLWPWLAIAGALSLALVAAVLRTAYGTLGNLGPSRSIIPDLVALPGYLVLALGVAGLAGVRRGHPDDTDAILDGVIASLAALTVAWVYLVTPAMSKQEVSFAVEVLMVAYPVASVFVFAMGARLMFSRGRRPAPAKWLILAGIFFLLLGDVVYMLVDSTLIDLPMRIVDIPYTVAFLAYSVAVLHPSVGRVQQSRTADEMAAGRGRLLAVTVALLVPALVLVTGVDGMGDAERTALGVIVMLLVGVAVLRVSRALGQHATSQARLAHQATHDALTGLPNRAFLSEHLERVFRSEAEVSGTVTLLHIDIDRFKLVNDTMGHGVGDELLVAVADRLSHRVRAQDLVVHTGGDEFAIIVTGLESEARALEFGERGRLMFKEPFTVRGNEISVTASVGIAFQAARTGSAESLVRDADTAVNHAKPGGGDNIAIFDTSMRERVAERLHLERELRNALTRGELSLHYQPKLRLSDARVVGMEALLRWNHPELGTVRPDKFIAIAEDTGMIVEIGAWVIDQACAELARIQELMPRGTELSMSVNVSGRQLRSDSLLGTITQALLHHRVRPDALCLELTESILMENLEMVSNELLTIRECGTRVSIDDFGTGYSSLAYLSKLPVDEIKIDRTFVKELGDDPSAASLIKAVVYIASSLGITTVAEGVETEEQSRQVSALGVREVQGFLYSRPVPADELPTVLARLGVASRPLLRSVPALGAKALGTIA